MPEQEDVLRSGDVKRIIEEERRKAFDEEAARIDAETADAAHAAFDEVVRNRRQTIDEILNAAHAERTRAEDVLHAREEDLRTALGNERVKKASLRKKEEEEAGRKADEERARREEQSRKRADEESRRHAESAKRKADEEDRRKVQEESRSKNDAERRRREEELRRQEEMRRVREEEERKRREEQNKKKEEEDRRKAQENAKKEAERREKEEEKRKQDDERRSRIDLQVNNARNFFAAGDFEHALVEIAKALVNDPMNSDALDLEAKIKDAQTSGLPQEVKEETEAAPAPKVKPKAKDKPKKRKPSFVIDQSKAKRTSFSAKPLIAAGIVALIIGSGAWYFLTRKPVVTPQVVFAVLPWGSSGAGLEESIEGSSLAEEVAERFEHINAPQLAGFSTSYGLSHRAANPLHSVFQLGAKYALTGRVTRVGDTLDVALELVDSLGRMAWSDGMAKAITQLAELPDDIAIRVADALNVPASERSGSFGNRRTARSGESYQFYLRGLELRHRRTADSQHNALLLFQQAIDLEPRFAEAFAEAADILATEYDRGWVPYDTAMARARQLAETAITADQSVSSGYIALGKILGIQRQYREALSNLNTALKLSPHSSGALAEKGKILLKTGKTTEGLEAILQAYKLNPRDPDICELAGNAHLFLGSPRQAIGYHETAIYYTDDSTNYITGPIADAVASDADLSLNYNAQVSAACERSINVDPADYASLYRLARQKQLLGKSQEAGNLLAKLEDLLQERLLDEPNDARALAAMALALTRLGRFPEAAGFAHRAVEADQRDALVRYEAAQVFALQMYSGKKKDIDPKKKEEGLALLKEAIGMQYRLDLLVGADFYNMRDLPEFQTLVKDTGQ